jgi:RND family efflux transporter MFP subunit
MAELQVKIAEEQVRVAEIQVEIAEEGVDTLQTLYDVAKPKWLEANNFTALIEAEANLNTARVNERMAESNLEVAKLSLKSAKLSLESAKLNLEKAVIAAPFDGVVADITIREGQEISTTALATPAITLVDTGRIEMRGLVDEVDVVMVKIGQAANITLDALPDEEIKGEVTFVSPVGTSLTGVVTYYQATITLEGPVAELKDGMSATAEVIVERRDDVLVVPNKAIRGSWANPWVEVYVDGQIVKREISLGLSDGRNTEVLSGLEEGEKVVLPAVEEWPSFFFM